MLAIATLSNQTDAAEKPISVEQRSSSRRNVEKKIGEHVIDSHLPILVNQCLPPTALTVMNLVEYLACGLNWAVALNCSQN